eukprot:4023782-Amphidinium_carterae.1
MHTIRPVLELNGIKLRKQHKIIHAKALLRRDCMPDVSAPPPQEAPLALETSRMRILQWNIQAIGNKKAELREVLERQGSPELVCLQETWMTPNKHVALPGYRLLTRTARPVGVSGGGTAIFARIDVAATALPSIQSADLEVTQAAIQLDGRTERLANVYFPSQSTHDTATEEQTLAQFASLVTAGPHIIGDASAGIPGYELWAQPNAQMVMSRPLCLKLPRVYQVRVNLRQILYFGEVP